MKNTDISIVIVSYNTKDLLRDCLESIFKNSKGLGVEIIVVDNNSSDGSVQYLKQLEKKKIKTIFNQENLGFSRANNQGIKISKGNYILLLNSDTQLKAGSLKSLIVFASKQDNVGVVGPRLLNADGTIQSSCFNFPTALRAFFEFWLNKKGFFEKFAPEGKKEVEVDAVVGAAFFIPRGVLDQVGLLDERYFFYFEDLDYCRKIKKANLKVFYLPRAQVVHLHGASAKKKGRGANQWLIKSSKIYHGLFNHYLINFIIWTGQKWQKLKNCC